ncbi:hypothetical protein HPB49_012869 [Dermacentor silvarum]|uniref:Uncharacterized protein n=1 Tax=Dermacentor silvarum TaxID=543639 RepID=A0ACB8DD48_DERSI|nr:hypothetical protein HPB49_012869 [Dermacentor silvarum]
MADCYGSLTDFADFAGRVHDITDDEAYRIRAAIRPRLRDRQNPMEVYNDAEFSWLYRFSKQAVLRLSEMLPLARKDNERGHPVPPLLQLLIALRFYCAGTFQLWTRPVTSGAGARYVQFSFGQPQHQSASTRRRRPAKKPPPPPPPPLRGKGEI